MASKINEIDGVITVSGPFMQTEPDRTPDFDPCNQDGCRNESEIGARAYCTCEGGWFESRCDSHRTRNLSSACPDCGEHESFRKIR